MAASLIYYSKVTTVVLVERLFVKHVCTYAVDTQIYLKTLISKQLILFLSCKTVEPLPDKTNNLGFWLGLTQTGLRSDRRWVEA